MNRQLIHQIRYKINMNQVLSSQVRTKIIEQIPFRIYTQMIPLVRVLIAEQIEEMQQQ